MIWGHSTVLTINNFAFDLQNLLFGFRAQCSVVMVWQMTMVIISRYSKRLLLLVNTDCPSLNYQKDPTHPIKSKWPFQIVSKYLHQESWFRMMMIKVTKVRLVKISAFCSNPSPPPILNTLIDQSGETQPLFSTRPPIFFTFLRFSIQPPNCLWNPYFQSDPTSWVNLLDLLDLSDLSHKSD